MFVDKSSANLKIEEQKNDLIRLRAWLCHRHTAHLSSTWAGEHHTSAIVACNTEWINLRANQLMASAARRGDILDRVTAIARADIECYARSPFVGA